MPESESAVSDLLRGLDDAMPANVAHQLQAAIVDEVARRSSGRAAADEAQAQAAFAKRTALGTFGENAAHRIGGKLIEEDKTTQKSGPSWT